MNKEGVLVKRRFVYSFQETEQWKILLWSFSCSCCRWCHL